VTTFQSIIYGIIHGFTQFLPISASAHERLIPYLFGWPEVEGAFKAALLLGSCLSLLVYFRHDWASIISSFLQVIIFRKRPMTLDERLPIFFFFTGIPIGLAWFYLQPMIMNFEWSPLLICGVLAAGGIPLFLTDSNSRKNKGMFDWNWLDALTVGISGVFLVVPGGGITEGMIPGALFRNYNRESATKYCFFAMFPVLLVSTYLHFRGVSLHSAQPSPDLTWLSFSTAALVTFLTGLLTIGGLMKGVHRKGFAQYVIYRFVLAAATVGVFWFRSRG
jgi:undecaprenyl-diphosphatase